MEADGRKKGREDGEDLGFGGELTEFLTLNPSPTFSQTVISIK